jgi:exopolysaccharide production protein ExoQ
MTASWDAAGPTHPRRIRGGDVLAPDPTAWRHQRRGPIPVLAVTEERYEHPPAERAAGLRLGGLTIDLDGLFAMALFLPMLFIVQLGTMGAAMVAALVPVYLFVRRERLERVLIARSMLFIIPAFAVFSTVWSEAPKETLKYAIELGITVVAGVLISSARSQEAVLRGMAVAFLAYALAAVVIGGTVGIGVGAGGSAMSGLTDSKNLLADIASTGLLVSMAVAMMAIRGRKWLWLAFGVFAMAIEFYAVTGARSAGALLGLAMGVGGMLALLPLLAAGKAVRAWLTSVVAVILIAVGLSYRWLAQAMIEIGASVFDKDPTLTGRTYLWYRAADLIQEKPMLGRGYYAFWLQGNIDAEGLWRYFGIQERGGFTFHNTLVDILVTLGWVGALVIAATLLVAAVLLVRKFVERPNLAMVFWVGILLYQVSRMGIETIGVAPFYFSTALFFAALGAAFGRVKVRKVARAPHRAPNRTLQLVAVRPVDYTGAAGWAHSRQAPAPGSLRLLRPDAERGR